MTQGKIDLQIEGKTQSRRARREHARKKGDHDQGSSTHNDIMIQ